MGDPSGKNYIRNAANDGWIEMLGGGGSGGSGSSTFLGLTDTPSTFTGQAGKVATVNVGETALEFAAASGGSFDTNFFATMSGDVALTTGTTYYKAAFDTIVKDDNSEWDAVNTKWVCPADGTYLSNVQLNFSGTTTGLRQIYIYVDGVESTQYLTSETPNNAGGFVVHLTATVCLTSGQTLEIYGRSTSSSQILEKEYAYWAINRLY